MLQPQPFGKSLEDKLNEYLACYQYCIKEEMKNVYAGNFDAARRSKQDSAFYMQEIERLSNYIEERKQIVRLLEKIGERDCERLFSR